MSKQLFPVSILYQDLGICIEYNFIESVFNNGSDKSIVKSVLIVDVAFVENKLGGDILSYTFVPAF